MGEREARLQLFEARQELGGQPAGQQEVELPAELGAARLQPLDARQQLVREAGFGRVDRRDVDAHAAHAERVHRRELRIGSVLVDVDDAAAARHLAHRVEHAAVVAQVSARLDEDEALEAHGSRMREVVLERGYRWLVAQLRVARRVAISGPEDVEMGVAGALHLSGGGALSVSGIPAVFSTIAINV